MYTRVDSARRDSTVGVVIVETDSERLVDLGSSVRVGRCEDAGNSSELGDGLPHLLGAEISVAGESAQLGLQSISFRCTTAQLLAYLRQVRPCLHGGNESRDLPVHVGEFG